MNILPSASATGTVVSQGTGVAPFQNDIWVIKEIVSPASSSTVMALWCSNPGGGANVTLPHVVFVHGFLLISVMNMQPWNHAALEFDAGLQVERIRTVSEHCSRTVDFGPARYAAADGEGKALGAEIEEHLDGAEGGIGPWGCGPVAVDEQHVRNREVSLDIHVLVCRADVAAGIDIEGAEVRDYEGLALIL